MRLHLDTDLGSDPDDACALVMVLGWPGVELVGVTTVADPDGRRAGYVTRLLELAGRGDVPVAAGAGHSLTTGRAMGGLPDHERYWGDLVAPPRPGPKEGALALLSRSIDQGATVAAIGPWTNLALLEQRAPGRLAGAPVVAMGGWVRPPAAGLPAWGPERDWNVQCDTRAAALVVERAAELTLSTLPGTMTAVLRAAHLPRLVASGPLGALLARQAEAHSADTGKETLGPAYAGLPDDLVNFHWDPLACAVALGWAGATVVPERVRAVQAGEVLRFQPDRGGRGVRVVTAVDGPAFAEGWLAAVERAQAS